MLFRSYYHENDQLRTCATCVKWTGRAEDPTQIVPLLDQAFAAVVGGRPGPALLEVPLDVLREETAPLAWPPLPAAPAALAPRQADIEALAALVLSWQRPLLLAGGGVITANASLHLQELAERLGAPVFHTAMGKCALPSYHPSVVGLPWHRATSDLRGMED